MAGIILLTTMAVGGFVLWRKRRNEKLSDTNSNVNQSDSSIP